MRRGARAVGVFLRRHHARGRCAQRAEDRARSRPQDPGEWQPSSAQGFLAAGPRVPRSRPVGQGRCGTPIRRGWCSPSPLKSTSGVQQTQKSFPTFWTAVPNQRAVVRNRSRRSSSLAAITCQNAAFIIGVPSPFFCRPALPLRGHGDLRLEATGRSRFVLSDSRAMSCIHAGNVASPVRRSSRCPSRTGDRRG